MIKTFIIEEETETHKTFWYQNLHHYLLKPGKWTFELKRLRGQRTVKQNRYYWGFLLTSIALETGYETEELHEFYKTKVGTKAIQVGEDKQDIPVSSAKMNTKEFSLFCEAIRKHALTEIGLSLQEIDRISIEEIREKEEMYSNRYY